MLPAGVRHAAERHLGPIRSHLPVGGGCINPAARLETASGPVFLKFNLSLDASAFQAEAEGLRQLRRAAGGLRVPEVLAVAGEGEGAPGWIVLEWLEPAPAGRGYGARLGEGLAELHRAPTGGGWGWERDGLIGSLPQPNGALPGWAEFWWERRLAPQLRRARDAGRIPATEREWEALRGALPELLAPAGAEGPSLLHGDLWSGNALAVRRATGGEAEPALIDPAVYRGHREVDLAMSELFGGLPADFLAAYERAWPLRPGYREQRRAVYQLYYLLVHVNLFGQGYAASTATTLRQVLSTLS